MPADLPYLMPEKPTRPTGELVFSLLLLGLGFAALVEAMQLGGFSRLSGPGFFPMLAAVVMVAGAAVSAARLLRRPGPEAGMPDGSVVTFRLVVVVVLIGAYVALMPAVGFMPATGLFLLAMLLYLWRRPFWQALLVTAASLVVIQVVFAEVFQVVLPKGTILPAGLW